MIRLRGCLAVLTAATLLAGVIGGLPLRAAAARPEGLNGVGPRLEVRGLGLIADHASSAPSEDPRLARP